jgi:hypothetical protein
MNLLSLIPSHGHRFCLVRAIDLCSLIKTDPNLHHTPADEMAVNVYLVLFKRS